MKKLLIASAFATSLLAFPLSASALEGDWEIGGDLAGAFFINGAMGGGAELFARYNIYDGLSISGGLAGYAIHATAPDTGKLRPKVNFGLYSMRVGIFYALDIINWVPSAGIHISTFFSENKDWKWHRGGNGFGADFDLQVQYRGIRHLGIGLGLSYHLMFTSPDYFTVNLSASWFSGEF